MTNPRDELRADTMGLGVQIPESVRPRSDHDIFLTIQYTLEKVALELAHIRSALGAGGSIPSVELDTDSKGQTKPHVKVYDVDPEHANTEAQRIYDELVMKYTPPFGTPK